jgi:hypothetical protein
MYIQFHFCKPYLTEILLQQLQSCKYINKMTPFYNLVKCYFNMKNVHGLKQEEWVLNELCFWNLSIVWCLKNKQNRGIKNYKQKITIHTSTNKSHKGQLLTTEQLTWAHTHIKPLKPVKQVAISDPATAHFTAHKNLGNTRIAYKPRLGHLLPPV